MDYSTLPVAVQNALYNKSNEHQYNKRDGKKFHLALGKVRVSLKPFKHKFFCVRSSSTSLSNHIMIRSDQYQDQYQDQNQYQIYLISGTTTSLNETNTNPIGDVSGHVSGHSAINPIGHVSGNVSGHSAISSAINPNISSSIGARRAGSSPQGIEAAQPEADLKPTQARSPINVTLPQEDDNQAVSASYTTWGCLKRFSQEIPFEIENLCLQVFWNPSKMAWRAKVEINNQGFDSVKQWEYAFSGSIGPTPAFDNVLTRLAFTGYDSKDGTNETTYKGKKYKITDEAYNYAYHCLALSKQEGYRKYQLGGLMVNHRNKGCPYNDRPLHIQVFVKFDKPYDLMSHKVCKDSIWHGEAMIILGETVYRFKIDWKRPSEKSNNGIYIGGEKIFHGFVKMENTNKAVDTGDFDDLDKDEWNL